METELLQMGTGTNSELLALIDALPFYVLLVDGAHHIILANKAVRTKLDFSPEEIIGEYCPKAVHGLDHEYPGCPLEQAVKEGRPVEREVFDEKTGRWVRSAIYPTRLVTPDGRIIYLHWVADITDRKQAEEGLKISQKRLRILSEHLEQVREEEKKKIANDLHDDTSQVVASLNAYLEAAISKLPPDSAESSAEVRALLKKAQDISTQIHDQLHKLIYELRPSILDDFGLVAAITWLTKNTLEVAGIDVNLRVSRRERNLPPEVRIALFRVIQESINNILNHAHAKNVTIILVFTGNNIKISIQDDGTGFDTEKVSYTRAKPRGLGILGMKERVALFGGTFNISSRPGEGTEINIEIPIKNDTLSKAP
jgi:PAS domain S-box-containing protein